MTRRPFVLATAFAALVTIAALPVHAQPPAQGRGGAPGPGRGGGFNAQPETIRLWEGRAPGAVGDADADTPTLEVFRAGRGGSGTAVVIAPGGAYRILSMNSEGRWEAAWFNALGVTAFVLKYRLGPTYRHPIELGDAQRAIRLVRARAAEFGVEPDRIGMMGFSAGGHLTATTGTKYDAGNPSAPDPIDRVSSRPDFLVLGYPVISFQTAVSGPDVLAANGASGRNLLGEAPDPKLLDDLSAELHVTRDTPPTFIFQTSDDTVVPVENSVAFYSALRKAGVPAEMHLFESGPHGSGMALTHPSNGLWTTLLANWMRGRGLLSRR